MSEAEKQEGQKTVVAFITGLLIGGLLVWVFSTTPEPEKVAETDTDTTTEEVSTVSEPAKSTTVAPEKTEVNAQKIVPVQGNGTLTVADQAAGEQVALGETKYPSDAGWIVVRDYADGAVGNILGAARYNLTDGLTPSSVSLLRKTVSGKTYQISFFTDNGDKAFSTKDDAPVTGGEATFKAN